MERTVHLTTLKADDLEVHVSTIVSDGQAYVEIREFVPSLTQYGRGIVIPKSYTASIIAGLQAAKKAS